MALRGGAITLSRSVLTRNLKRYFKLDPSAWWGKTALYLCFGSYALPNMLCRFTTCYNDCRFTTCLLFVFHRRMGTVLLLSHTVWGELAFHTLSFTGRAKYEDSISCVTRWDFLFTTSVSATPVGLVKKDLLLERLDLLLALPSIPLPRYLSAVSTAQSTLHLSCAGL